MRQEEEGDDESDGSNEVLHDGSEVEEGNNG